MEAPNLEQIAASGAVGPPAGTTSVLIVEDDLGDAVLVKELLSEADPTIGILMARSIAEARPLLARVNCVLLDLGLPDARGLEAVRQILALDPGVAVVVLTGLADRSVALAAVAVGAQDYLGKDELELGTLTRTVRYAVERKRADEAARQLFANKLVAAESARLERGLLPRPLLGEGRVDWASRYRPGGGSLLLGGDFFDAVELADGTVRLVIGDVCGHGPDEAAVGVALRIAWRSLVLAGTDETEMLTHLQSILVAERADQDLFVTVCDATIEPGAPGPRMRLRVAGHPPPVTLTPVASLVDLEAWGPPLGVSTEATWPTVSVPLAPGWALLFYTDGIIEGHNGDGSDRWDTGGLLEALFHHWDRDHLDQVADQLIARAEEANGGPLPDDVALFFIASGGATAP